VIFSLVGFVLLPLLALVALEGVLRLAGVGYNTAFFREQRIGGELYLVENDKFGWRFFPREVARSPAPIRLKPVKAPGTIRVFVFGESSALGDPRPAFGAPRYLQALLEKRFPDRTIEVVCVGVTAINSHAILPIARACKRLQGDAWVLYLGNNELIGPFGATTVFGTQSPPLWHARAVVALQQTRLGQLLFAAAARLSKPETPRQSWGGMRMFLETRCRHRARVSRRYANFERNLEDIVRCARSARCLRCSALWP
jgi:hypothetical protein